MSWSNLAIALTVPPVPTSTVSLSRPSSRLEGRAWAICFAILFLFFFENVPSFPAKVEVSFRAPSGRESILLMRVLSTRVSSRLPPPRSKKSTLVASMDFMAPRTP